MAATDKAPLGIARSGWHLERNTRHLAPWQIGLAGLPVHSFFMNSTSARLSPSPSEVPKSCPALLLPTAWVS